MTSIADTASSTQPRHLWARYGALAVSYFSLMGGSVGRLGFSLVYFLVLANTLSLASFGVFAAASAAGVVLSRLFGLGFSSPLYRVSTVKPHLTGVYLGGYLLMGALSLPLVVGASTAVYALGFAGRLEPEAFALFVVSEVLLWRSVEIIIIFNNGFHRFGLGALLTIAGTALRMVAVLGFAYLGSDHSLERWAELYLSANAIALALAIAFGMPKTRVRFVPRLYWRRMTDALAVAGAEMVFYAQQELDKVLMLMLASPQAAGLYAITMRLVDLTAIPVRAFNTLLVQRLMRSTEAMRSWARRIGTEAGIFAASTGAILFLALALAVKPDLLGANVAQAAPVILLAWAIPGPRNIVEYHSELLYARGQTVIRMGLLLAFGAVKFGLMALIVNPAMSAEMLIATMAWIFIANYFVSAAATYPLIGRRATRI